jgi:hypothetical protein
MRSFLCFLTLLSATFGSVRAGDKPVAVNEHVKYSAETKKKSLKPGEAGEILISLKPVKGIHINLTPPISVRFDTVSGVRQNGVLTIPAHNKFLDDSKKIVVPFLLPATMRPGVTAIKAELTYYYCSDAEGWCSRFKQPVEIPLNVTK